MRRFNTHGGPSPVANHGGRRPGAGRPRAGTVRLQGPRVPADLAAELQARCDAEGMSVPEAMREALTVWLAAQH